jgi:hypothetical protein
MFSNYTDFDFTRIALTMDQIDQYKPPPDPAKLTDSRADGYVAQYGYQSWELDALQPKVLVDLLEEQIAEYRDQEIWDEVMAKEAEMIEELQAMAKEYKEKKET